MVEWALTAASPLGGVSLPGEDVCLEEIEGMALVSASVPRGGESAFAGAVQSALSAPIPSVGAVTRSKDGQFRLLGMQQEQIFLLFPADAPTGVEIVREKLGNNGYYSDQSDGWAMLRLNGPLSRSVLRRLCPLDLHADQFGEDRVARTMLEHMAVILCREGADGFILLSPRSSAISFLHALETAISSVRAETETSN